MMFSQPAIEADEPRRVAMVLAELWGGGAEPSGAGAWAAHARDDEAVAVAVVPRADDAGARLPRLSMGTLLDVAHVLAIAGREGWPATARRRANSFGTVDMWIERRQLVEVITAEVPAEHVPTMLRPGWRRMLSSVVPGES